MTNIARLIKFIEFAHEFRKVERALNNPGETRMENDVEHSFQLAFTAWYIVSIEKLDFNLDKILRYALLHDLVEIYAGDTDVFGKDAIYRASKAERERVALEKLRSILPEFNDALDIISQYEQKADPESRFVYALDKILPVINIYLDEGKYWKQREVTLTAMLDEKIPKVGLSLEVKKYFDEFVVLLKEKESTLFHQT